MTEEDKTEYKKAFKAIPNATGGSRSKLVNKQGVTAWSNKTKESTQTNHFQLPTLLAEYKENKEEMEEEFWKDISLIVTQDNQHEANTDQNNINTEDTPQTVQTIEGDLAIQGPEEVSYEALDENSSSADHFNLYDWSDDSF